jgi:hypothetical protein
MNKNILYMFTVMFLLSENTSAQDINTNSFFRFTDNSKAYGQICEEYEYITPWERLKLLDHNDAMFADILRDSHAINKIDIEKIVETNTTKCQSSDADINSYSYKEKLTYINENIIAIQISQYEYVAEAASKNTDVSYFLYDRAYGMSLVWEDLFGSDKSLDVHILKRVIEELADEDFIYKYDNKYKLLNFRVPGYFSINDKGLRVQYGKYEIAPATSGLPSIIIGKDILKKFMDADKYAKYFPVDYQIITNVVTE